MAHQGQSSAKRAKTASSVALFKNKLMHEAFMPPIQDLCTVLFTNA
jgi:hypothetical protein